MSNGTKEDSHVTNKDQPTPIALSLDAFELELIKYMDIPYFKNNPSNIERWRTYYEKTNDPNVLLLLINTDISCNYHWIYIQLSKVFIEMGKREYATKILNHALQTDVYNREEILKYIGKHNLEIYKKSGADLLRDFRRSVIKCMGRIFYLEEKRIERNPNVIRKTNMINNTSENVNNKMEKLRNEQEPKENEIKITKELERVKFTLSECLSFSDESLEFSDYKLIISKEISPTTFSSTKISTDDEPTTIRVSKIGDGISQNIQISIIENRGKSPLWKNILNMFTWENSGYISLIYNPLCDFKSIYSSVDFKERPYKIFYLIQVLEYIRILEGNSLYITSLDSFVVNDRFILELSSAECLSISKLDINAVILDVFGISLPDCPKVIETNSGTEEYLMDLRNHKEQILDQ